MLAVAGVPGGTFSAMFGPLGVPRPLRHRAGVAAARLARRISPAFDTFARLTPLTPTTARVIAHSGFLLPGATPERLLPTLAEFREHDFRWYFTLALAAAEHRAVEDLARIAVPVTLVAGRWDVLTSPVDMARAAASITDAEFRVLDGSHFLPIEFPGEIAAELRALLARCHPA
jgi:pimeloyl-ACP methyl ester carboxylesterase